MSKLKTFTAVFLLCINAFGQEPEPAPAPPVIVPPEAPLATVEKSSTIAGPRRQLALIIFSGLGGAVLGLSTLSFYGRPQDHLVNIAIGAAVGVISGTVYVTYRAASEPQEFYGLYPQGEVWAAKLIASQQTNPLKISYAWTF